MKKINTKFILMLSFTALFFISSFITMKYRESTISDILQTIIFFLLLSVSLITLLNFRKNEKDIKKIKSLINLNCLNKLSKKINNIKFNKKRAILIYFIISTITLSKLLLSPGVIGFRDDWSIPPYNEQVIEWAFEEKEAWQKNGFGVTNVYPSQYMFRFSLGALSFLFNLNGEALSKILLILILTISGFSGFYLGKVLGLKKDSSFITGLFYMLTPVLFNRIIPGYLSYLFSYAILPFILGLFIKYTNEHFKLNNLFKLGVITSLGFTHINFIILIPGILIIYSIIDKDYKKILKKILWIIGMISIASLMHLNWILPLLKDMAQINEILASKTNVWVESFHPPITNSMLLFGASFGFFSQVIQQNLLLFLLWTFSSLCLISIIFSTIISTKNKQIIKISLITILFIIISKGSSPPFGSIFNYFYDNINLLILFRDLHNILIIVCLGYSIILGYSLKIFKIYFKEKYVPFIGIFALIILFSWPFFTGNFGGYLRTYNPNEEYQSLFLDLKQEIGDHRILWLPPIGPISYDNYEFEGIDSLTLYSPKETNLQVLNSNTDQENYVRVLDKILHENITYNLHSFLNLANIKYLIYREDYYSKFPEFSYMTPEVNHSYNNKVILNILEKQNKISLIMNESSFSIFEVDSSSFDKISIATKNYLVNDYNQLLSGNILFSGQINNLSPLKDLVTNSINNTLELISSFIPNKYKIDIGDHAIHEDANKGWTPYYKWSWYKWDYTSQIENGALSKFPDELEINLNIEESTNHTILTKTFFSQDSSNITISIDNIQLSNINTTSHTKGFKWINLDNINLGKGTHSIKITSGQGENAISRIIIVPNHILNNSISQKEEFLKSSKINSKDNFINSTKISNTLYQIEINATTPFILSFKESYDKDWTLKSDEEFHHFKCNGYANCYLINKTGFFKARLFFERQKFFKMGQNISLISIISIISIILYKQKRI